MKRRLVYQEVDYLIFSDKVFTESVDEFLRRGPSIVYKKPLSTMSVVTDPESVVRNSNPMDSETLRCTVFNQAQKFYNKLTKSR